MTPLKPQYTCVEPGRLIAVRDQAAINGIEYLEVDPDDQTILMVHFVHALPGIGNADEVPFGKAKLTTANVRIDGGVRVTGIRVLQVDLAGNMLKVITSAAGDFSTYTLRLVKNGSSDEVPTGYDPRLASVEFSFKAGCPSEFDCEQEQNFVPELFSEPAINYRAKDHGSFRRLMLDRLSVLMPGWRDRSPADPMITLVEALALTADHLSYWQDAVATEAYLGTARRRVSVRRHARLLDYPMHDGCNARTWVQFALAKGNRFVPAHSQALTHGTNNVVELDESGFLTALQNAPVVFGTMHDVTLRLEHNAIALYTWSDSACILPRGSTRATLVNAPKLSLAAGDWLLFEEVFGPTTGLEADANPQHRQVVRLTSVIPATDPLSGDEILEVQWDSTDALRFSLCLDAVPNAPIGTFVSRASGNLALADHGVFEHDANIRLDARPTDRPPTAELRHRNLTFAVPFDQHQFDDEAAELALPVDQRVFKTFLTATAALETSAKSAVPSIALTTNSIDEWTARADLLSSDRFAREFVVEMESDGTTMVRFGDNVHGLRPAEGSEFVANYRVGNGRAGNLGAGVLTNLFIAAPHNGIKNAALPRIESVRNPLPAVGGVDPESMESVRQFAPQAFRRQERAVTTSDWAEVAERDPAVQRAAARYRWTGSWHTAFVAVDWRGGTSLNSDVELPEEFLRNLDRYRLAGYDLEIESPVFVPLDIKLKVCARKGYFRSDVKAGLLDCFSATVRHNGTPGFFHPDNFTFGQALYISRIYEAAMKVTGVESVRVVRFQRYGKVSAGEIADGLIAMSQFEIVRCDNDPNFPESGRLEIDVDGGL